MIYLYGITGPVSKQPAGRGLEGATLHTLEIGSLTAVYSTHEFLEVRAEADVCWAHEEAVESLMRSQAILPARFGTVFRELEALRDAIGRQAESLSERLAEVEGCVELAVRINPLSPRDGNTASGQQYLMDKLLAQRRREALAESALSCLRELAVDSRVAASQTSQDTVSISYLVRTGGVERFSRAVDRLQRRWPQFALSCTGPWAPYSFVADRNSRSRELVT